MEEGGQARLLVGAALCFHRGDEAAFLALVGRHQRAMLRVARLHIASGAAAPAGRPG